MALAPLDKRIFTFQKHVTAAPTPDLHLFLGPLWTILTTYSSSGRSQGQVVHMSLCGLLCLCRTLEEQNSVKSEGKTRVSTRCFKNRLFGKVAQKSS